MGKIKILPENVANQIAAGEVIVRPASVVKELVENSIDAKAKNIKITIKNAGKKLIEVVDDGIGMSEEDAKLAFLRYATSKINTIYDLNNISTFGFRGEALAAISSVSKVEIMTKTDEGNEGTYLYLEKGKIIKEDKIALNTGTIIRVKDLFYNTPARLKFLKSDYTEENHIIETVMLSGYANDNISFELKIDEKNIIYFPPNVKTKERIKIVNGEEIYNNLLNIEKFTDNVKIYGFITKPQILKTNRNFINIFVNRRPILSRQLLYAIYEGYGTLLPKGTYPVAYIFIEINPNLIDVNVHPAKAEIKFKDERQVFNLLKQTISETLNKIDLSFDVGLSKQENSKLKNSVENVVKEYFVNDTQETLFKSKTVFLKKDYNENKTEKIISEKRNFLNIKILGQVSNTYIIGEDEKNLIIIDQHAAHEKVLYEQFLNEVMSKKVKIQELLIPEIIDVNPTEINLIENNKSIFEELGFYLERFGEKRYKITAHPIIIKNKLNKEFIKEIIESIKEKEKTEKEEVLKEIIARTACRAAVKAGDILEGKEIESLVSEYFEIDSPFSCPHGRPAIVKISFLEIEKMFKRKK